MVQSIQVRLGNINFINCLPLAYGLKYRGMEQGVDMIAAAPAVLNGLIIEGRLDISPVSSIIYALNRDKLFILPNLSISASGFLQSILLASKRPITELNNARVALTTKSATSRILLKIILNKAYQLTPEYFPSEVGLQTEVLKEADAALFIGDDALYAYHNKIPGCYYYDIGQEWRKLTGQAMVYALWVVTREFAESQPGLLQKVYERLTAGFAHGLANIQAAAACETYVSPFSAGQITDYLQLLNYTLTPAHLQALLTYYELAQEMGFIDGVPELNFASVE
ncbi:menaquinone biosynthetic enzyme MqnA/MqnD family protein [Sporomusa aerivorans]|uniref:menaquinone biosynthetic enzyme MqnA/MqnD family protein n=1 Tax=Sporomusa aerivorans TaxID=204936 RepID=UPI00352A5CAE